jgi:molybdopterin-guanine dinucleotide biosynthesis protein A
MSTEVTGLILAGGRGSRLGGADKGWLEVASKPMVVHVVERLAPQVDRLLISANRNLESYASLGFEVVTDADAGFLGPLAGVLAGLKVVQSQWMATIPCDSPLVPADLIDRLKSAAEASAARIAVARDTERLQPVFALYQSDLKADLENYLAAGERKIDRWMRRHEMTEVDFSDREEMFLNVNTPDERDLVEARIKSLRVENE